MRRMGLVGAAAAAVLLLGAGGGQARLQPGQVLDRSTWEQAKDLLPPEILQHYRKGEYASPHGYRYVNIAGGGLAGSFGENLKANRATVGDPSSKKGAPNEIDASLPMDLFQQEKLVQTGR